jgi:hypothetical protein
VGKPERLCGIKGRDELRSLLVYLPIHELSLEKRARSKKFGWLPGN